MPAEKKENSSPLRAALEGHEVKAIIADVDHIKTLGVVAVETNYIITIESAATPPVFEPFSVSKTYAAFRELACEMQTSVNNFKSLPPSMDSVAKFCELISTLIESQHVSYLGKTNLPLLKSTTKERRRILREVLITIGDNFPTAKVQLQHSLASQVAGILEMFLLTDCVEMEASGFPLIERTWSKDSADSQKKKWFKRANAAGENLKKIIVKPITRKIRPEKGSISLVEPEPSTSEDHGGSLEQKLQASPRAVKFSPQGTTTKPSASQLSPVLVLGGGVVALLALHYGSLARITLDADIAFLIVFAAFCAGWNLPNRRSAGLGRAKPRDPGARKLLRRSVLGPQGLASPKGSCLNPMDDDEEEDDDFPEMLESPLPVFPAGAAIGSHNNCWSNPAYQTFKVRGKGYLKDRKKVPSAEFLFPCRGIDLFLTDACPEDVGQNCGIMGGNLRKLPTFIINFRLPWGVLIFYFEIPDMYVPFLQACYEKDYDRSKLPSLDTMSPAQRTACRFLMGDQAHKNATLKIVPVVVQGPVSSVAEDFDFTGTTPDSVMSISPINYSGWLKVLWEESRRLLVRKSPRTTCTVQPAVRTAATWRLIWILLPAVQHAVF